MGRAGQRAVYDPHKSGGTERIDDYPNATKFTRRAVQTRLANKPLAKLLNEMPSRMDAIAESIRTPAVQLPGLSTARLARKGGIALCIKLSTAAIALVTQVVLARSLGYSRYGDFAYAFGW